MKTMQQEMREFAQKLEKAQNEEIAKFANIGKKFYMGDNVVILDFSSENFPNAILVSEEIAKNPQIMVKAHIDKRRISLIF